MTAAARLRDQRVAAAALRRIGLALARDSHGWARVQYISPLAGQHHPPATPANDTTGPAKVFCPRRWTKQQSGPAGF